MHVSYHQRFTRHWAPSSSPLSASPSLRCPAQSTHVITGQAAFTDYSQQKPGHDAQDHRRRPARALSQRSRSTTEPAWCRAPAAQCPRRPAGFKVELYSSDFKNPRLIRTAPNGDLFVVESEPIAGRSGTVKVFRGVDGERQGEAGRDLRHRPEAALRHRLLSARRRIRSGSTSATPTRSCASPTRTAT